MINNSRRCVKEHAWYRSQPTCGVFDVDRNYGRAVAVGGRPGIMASLPANWTEHTAANGRIFWHNKKTGSSTWEKPECLKTELEMIVAQQTSWKEFKANDGRLYWFNEETRQSVWDCPEEIVELKRLLEETTWDDCSTKPVARQKVKLLFKFNNFSTKTRWEDALQILKNDARFRKYFACLTTGERKQAFIEFQNQLTKEMKEKERERKYRARQAYAETFHKILNLTPGSTQEAFEKINAASWWGKALSAPEKADLFNELMDEFEETYWAQNNEERELMREKLVTFMRDSPLLDFSMSWAEASEVILKESEFSTVDPKDLFTTWEAFVCEQDARCADLYTAVSYTERRKRRDAFRALLRQLIQAADIKGRAIFADSLSRLCDEVAYRKLLGVPLATPREIFHEETEFLTEKYEREKSILKAILRANEKARVTAISTFEDLMAALETEPAASKISQTNLELFYESLKRRALRRRTSVREAGNRRHDQETDSPKPMVARARSRGRSFGRDGRETSYRTRGGKSLEKDVRSNEARGHRCDAARHSEEHFVSRNTYHPDSNRSNRRSPNAARSEHSGYSYNSVTREADVRGALPDTSYNKSQNEELSRSVLSGAPALKATSASPSLSSHKRRNNSRSSSEPRKDVSMVLNAGDRVRVPAKRPRNSLDDDL